MMIELLSLAYLMFPGSQVTSSEVTFQGEGLTLSGVLDTPSKDGDFPAVLLLPGSGPTDRDGNQLPGFKTDLLKDLSAALNEAGYATLRFDKRPVRRYLTVWPKEMTALSKFFSLENHLVDVAAAYKFLASQDQVDNSKLFLLGHSEGGLFANRLSATLKPHGVILLGAPGRKMDVILSEQLHKNIGQLPDGELKTRLLSDTDRAIAELKSSPKAPQNIHPSLAAIFGPSTPDLLHGYFNLDPIEDIKAFHGPVFIANGESDVQISAERDTKPLAVAAGDRATVYIAQNSSHNFKFLASATDPGIQGPVTPGLVTNLLSWIKKHSN